MYYQMTYYFGDLNVRRAFSRLAEEVEIDWDKDYVFKYYTWHEGKKEPTEHVLVHKEHRVGDRKKFTCWQQNNCTCVWCRYYNYPSPRPFFSENSYHGLMKQGKSFGKQKGMKKQFQKWMKFELQSLDNI